MLCCHVSVQVSLGTTPSRPACATERSSSSPLTPWRPRPCTPRATAPTTTTNRSPTRTSSPASCDQVAHTPAEVTHRTGAGPRDELNKRIKTDHWVLHSPTRHGSARHGTGKESAPLPVRTRTSSLCFTHGHGDKDNHSNKPDINNIW